FVARGLAQVARDTRLGIGQRGDRHPRLVHVEHAQALEGTDVDAVAAAAADLFLHHGLGPLGASDLLSRVAEGVEDGGVRARAAAPATVDTHLRIDEIDLFFDAVDGGDGADRLTRAATDALFIDEIRHRDSHTQSTIRGARSTGMHERFLAR